MTDFDINEFMGKFSSSKDFSLLSWQDKTDLCESNHKSWKVTNNGGYRRVKNFYCNHYKEGPDGEPPCRICKDMREKARRKEISSKVASAFNGNQFMHIAVTTNEDDTRRLGYRIKKKKANYISIPSGENGGRIFLMDRFDELSSSEAVDVQMATTMFLHADCHASSGNLAGNIKPEVDADDSITYMLPVKLHSIPEVDSELMHDVETEAILTIGFDEITIDNAAMLIAKKLEIKLKILEECGFSAVSHAGEKEVTVRLSQLKDTWYTARVSIVSNLSLDRFPVGIAMKIKEAEHEGLRKLREDNRGYLRRKAEETR
jgi:hypothetical protein